MSRQRYNEIIDRVCYMYMEANGEINFPNSFEGDLLKLAYKTAVEAVKKPKLTENQQIVLGWLKEKYTLTDIEPIELFWRLRANSVKPKYRDRVVYKSYRYMTETAQLQVLQTFSQWAIEQEEE